jgi:FKBP-type peptidyl-prolyl cis-trans isomerase 2
MNKTDAMCLAAIVLVIVVIISALTYNWYNENFAETDKKKEKTLEVEYGVGIKFDYTWRLRTNNDVSKCPVFATTSPSVANNDSIPKTVTFSEIVKFNPLEPVGMYQKMGVNDQDLISTFGTGFYEGILGMKESESRTFFVKSDEGPIEYDQNLIREIPVSDSIPMFETIDRVTFESEYPNELPLQIGQTFTHNYWKWTIEIEEMTNNTVKIKHDPDFGMDLDLFPWNATVNEVSSEKGTIGIHHKITTEFVNYVIDSEVLTKYDDSFKNITEIQTESDQAPLPGIIISVDDEIVIDFNREIAGKDYVFEVTILEIEEGDAYK